MKVAKEMYEKQLEDKPDYSQLPIDVYALTMVWGDNSPYIRSKNLRIPAPLSEEYLAINRGNVRKYLKPYFKDKPISKLRTKDFHEFVNWLTCRPKPLAASTISNIVGCLNVTVRYAAALEHIPLNIVPTGKLSSRYGKKRDAFTVGEVQALLNAAWGDEVAKLATLVVFLTGIRMGELRALRVDDISGNNVEIDESFSKVAGIKCPKNRKKRQVVLPDSVIESMLSHQKEDPENSGFIFWGTNGRPISDRRLTAALMAAAKAIGITPAQWSNRLLGFHALRHSHVSAMRGVLPGNLMGKMVGHADGRTTDRYDHLTTVELSLAFREVTSLHDQYRRRDQ